MKRMLIIGLITLSLASCVVPPKEGKAALEALQDMQKATIPYGAKITKDCGNGWFYFDFDGHTFLYHSAANGSVMTLIE